MHLLLLSLVGTQHCYSIVGDIILSFLAIKLGQSSTHFPGHFVDLFNSPHQVGVSYSFQFLQVLLKVPPYIILLSLMCFCFLVHWMHHWYKKIVKKLNTTQLLDANNIYFLLRLETVTGACK